MKIYPPTSQEPKRVVSAIATRNPHAVQQTIYAGNHPWIRGVLVTHELTALQHLQVEQCADLIGVHPTSADYSEELRSRADAKLAEAERVRRCAESGTPTNLPVEPRNG